MSNHPIHEQARQLVLDGRASQAVTLIREWLGKNPHDEIALSVKTIEEAREAAHIMATAVDLEVPSRVDVEMGPSWGEAK